MKWVTVKKLSEISGYTVKAIQNKVDRGIWRRGIHMTIAPDGRRLFNIASIEKWIEGSAR